MTELGRVIRSTLAGSPWLRPIPVELSGSDWPQTIFPFEILRTGSDRRNRRLAVGAAKQVHRWLNTDLSGLLPAGTAGAARHLAALTCHFGQPVAIGRSAALRVCIGAQLVCATACDRALGSSLRERLKAQSQRARLALRKAELIAEHYEALCAAGAAVSEAMAT